MKGENSPVWKGGKITQICLQCGETFKTHPAWIRKGGGKYCSRECSDKGRHNQLAHTCLQCGKEFLCYPSRRGVYCSNECYHASRRGKKKYNEVTQTCLQCGKEFSASPNLIKKGYAKYCSRKCGGKGRRTSITRKCSQCGKEFKIFQSTIKRGHGMFCSKKCKGKATSGENSPQWCGGKSFEPYGIEFNDALKREVRDRDGHICQICSEPEDGKALAIHHIDYDKQNNNINNLVALCKSCHSKTNGHRNDWEERLSGL